jgi:hypothetical protein
MTFDEELKQLGQNTKKDIRQLYEKVKLYPLISLFFLVAIFLVIILPYFQVNYQGISNNTEKATLENQYRATLAQISGGVAIGIGLYYTWRRITIAEEDLKATQENLKVAQENLKVSQESQITERFTRAVEQLGAIDQLGNPAIEIRLGGIYALERIANESEKDYWPIVEILTAYIRKNSPNDDKHVAEEKIIPFDIQAILTVLGRCKNSFNNGETNCLDLSFTYLHHADLSGAHLEGTNFEGADLHWSYLEKEAHFEGADFKNASLEITYLKGANFRGVNLEGAFLRGADLEGVDFEGANLEYTWDLTIEQLSEVKTLYNSKLDKWIETPLREKHPALFEKPD